MSTILPYECSHGSERASVCERLLMSFYIVIQGEIQAGSWPMAVYVPCISLNHIW